MAGDLAYAGHAARQIETLRAQVEAVSTASC